MAKEFNGKNICTKCKHTFNWWTYYLDKNELIVGKIPTNVKSINKLQNGNYLIVLNCPNCGHSDVVEKVGK